MLFLLKNNDFFHLSWGGGVLGSYLQGAFLDFKKKSDPQKWDAMEQHPEMNLEKHRKRWAVSSDQNEPVTLHCTGFLIGILIMAY